MALLSLLLLLLTLSSVSLQDLQDQNGLEDTVPADRSTRLLPPAKLRQKRQTPFDNGNLKWISWSGGSLPNGTVSIQNDYANRVDYVCKFECHAGFYNPSKGHACHYPYGDKEYQESRFELLVNEDKFEILEWKDGYSGSVPEHSVRTCSSDKIYVGRNKYGLGKVDPKQQAFYLPWEGTYYWYYTYQVLTFKRDVESEHIAVIEHDDFLLFYPTANPDPEITTGVSALPDMGNLKWKQWSGGSLPNGIVSIYNTYTGSTDYICKHACYAGFYNPTKGSFCHYIIENSFHSSSTFQFLVNEDKFEILEWKDGYSGSVPEHSVRTCSSDKIYVGRNKYGLGQVDPKQQAFYLPWEGTYYWYKNYQALTFNRDVENEHVSDVEYDTGSAVIVSYPPEVMTSTTVINNECKQVVKIVGLSKTSRVEKRWDVGTFLTVGVKKTFTAGIPTIATGSVEVSAEVSVQASGGETYSEEIGHSLSVEITVPPNHRCKARMLGHKYKIDIPFTARLTRTFSDGRTKWRFISGTYNGVQVGEVHTEVERCVPLPNAKPCP